MVQRGREQGAACKPAKVIVRVQERQQECKKRVVTTTCDARMEVSMAGLKVGHSPGPSRLQRLPQSSTQAPFFIEKARIALDAQWLELLNVNSLPLE